jgi:(E)-4-hydroxy-3-methylbut-2-enyl-diphosphate synthase
VITIAERVEVALAGITAPIQVAVMGCLVNGPGEAREADVGLALSKHGGTLFRKGERIREVSADEMVEALLDEARTIAGDVEGDGGPTVVTPGNGEAADGKRRRLPVRRG